MKKTPTLTMKTGYAFEASAHDVSNDNWDTAIYSPTGGEVFMRTLTIDGWPHAVFQCPDGMYRAQLVSYCRI